MLHFSDTEFARRRAEVKDQMARRGLDALLLFAPETHYWLTGYDTFGYCFFQCLIWEGDDSVLLTRSADLRQAQLTSTITDIRVWKDGAGSNPAADLKALLAERGLAGKRLGIEFDTPGLTAFNWRRIEAQLGDQTFVDVSDMFTALRLVKSDEELAHIRRAGELADDALDAGIAAIVPGAGETEVLTAMQGAVFAGGGGYPGNPFIVGSGEHALLCRTHAGRQAFEQNDQLTLEWAGVFRNYHAAAMRTVVIGSERPEHRAMHAACREALLACEDALRPGRPMGEVFAAHAGVMDSAGFAGARLNACGYSMGASYAPCWMDFPMFFEGADTIMASGMVFFLHMILMDSDSGSAMSLGRSSIIHDGGAEPLSRLPLDMIVV